MQKAVKEIEYGNKVLLYKGYPVFGKQISPAFARVPKEYKENEACFIFVNQGEVNIRASEEHFGLDRNHAVLAKCMNYFMERTPNQIEKSESLEAIGILLFPAIVEDIFEFDLSVSNYSIDFNTKQIVVDRLLNNFRESIDMLLDNPELADESMIKTKLKEFVLLISKSQNAPSELDFLAAIFKPKNIEFKNTIHKNLFSNLSLDELASLTHMSLSSFKRKFKETFDSSPKKYIALKKVERAAELLAKEGLRVSDVAYDVGFDSIATFNRNFTSIYGKSPSDYRLELK